MTDIPRKKRAIALAGGGPAAGLHIGALEALEEAGIRFDVFALSCVGAWVGIVYHTRDDPQKAGRSRARQTYEFFEKFCFRDDASYAWFPVNRGFAPDFLAMWSAWAAFPFSRDNDWTKLVPTFSQGCESVSRWLEHWRKPGGPTLHDINLGILNDYLALMPWTRFLTSMAYKSEINGLARVYYEDSPALAEVFKEDRLYAKEQPEIYHNAWRMRTDKEKGEIQIFHNHGGPGGTSNYRRITAETLCACSALPFIEQSVPMEGHDYTEGALVDTVNFANLLRDHPQLDEVWVSRIVDEGQVRSAHTLAAALANLPMQFAAEVGEDDIKLFRQHLLNQSDLRPRVVEIPIKPDTEVGFDWSHANLRKGCDEGYEAVQRLLAFDEQLTRDTVDG